MMDRIEALVERGVNRLHELSQKMADENPEAFVDRMHTTMVAIGRAWLGDHDEIVKELMETLADADVQAEIKKEAVALSLKGQLVLP